MNFPPLCPNCGSAASKRLTYTKHFRRSFDSETSVDSTTLVRVPFCDPCIAQHKAESPNTNILANLASRLLSAAHALGVLGFSIAAAVAGYFAVYHLGQQQLKYVYPLALLALFLVIPAWAFYGALRAGTEYLRAQEQTGMTGAFDFSNSTAEPFESNKFVCTMKNERFAEAFRQCNKAIEFEIGSPVAQADRHRARRNFWIATLAVAILALYMQFRK